MRASREEKEKHELVHFSCPCNSAALLAAVVVVALPALLQNVRAMKNLLK
jgi:hypothetical protein